jgi:hypothetical protein
MRSRLLTFAMGLLLSLGAVGTACAQTTVRSTGFRDEEIVDDTLLRAGRWEASLTLSGGWSYASIAVDDHTESQNAVYVTPALALGYMLTDALELRVALGALYLRTDSASGTLSQDHVSGLGALQALYHVPIVLGMALYGGVGAGGYYGVADRPAAGGVSRNRFVNGGFLGQGMVGLLVQPGSLLFLRGGLRADFLVGSESAEDPAVRAGSAFAFDFLLNAELVIGLRFG